MEAMAARIRKDAEATHLITLEDLAELPQPAVDCVLDALEEFDVEIIITARHWCATLPSEWQQDVKARDTVAYADYLAAVRDRRPGSETFLARQDLPGIADRWGGRFPRERTHVVTVPPRGTAGPGVLELFCGVIGIDPETLNDPGQAFNNSLSLPQAELVRRVNESLGDRLADVYGSYREAIRMQLTRQTLMTKERSSIGLPAEFVEWALGESRRQRDALLASGVHIVGDPAYLVPTGDQIKVGPVAPSAEEVLAVAVRSLADYASERWAEESAAKQRIAELTDQVAALERKVTRLESAQAVGQEATNAGNGRSPSAVRRWLGRLH